MLWSRGLARSRDKEYLYYHGACGYQIWQDGWMTYQYDLPWWAPTYKVLWCFNQVVLRDHMTSKKQYISNTTVTVAAKLGRTYFKRFPSIKLIDPLATSSSWIMWETNIIITPLLWCQTWQGDDLPWGALVVIVTRPLITWSCLIMWQIKNLIFYYYNTYGH